MKHQEILDQVVTMLDKITKQDGVEFMTNILGEMSEERLLNILSDLKASPLGKEDVWVERKDLVEGKEYWMGRVGGVKGIFRGRSEASIYFESKDKGNYGFSHIEGMEGLIPFDLEGQGFIEVEVP